MSNRIVWSSDGNRSKDKIECPSCSTKVWAYIDGTVEVHKVYLWKKVKGRFVKTNNWTYCDQKSWG